MSGTTGETGVDAGNLIARCLDGDDVAKAEFVNAYGDLIRRATARKLAALSPAPPVRGDVDDICNDLLARLLDNNCRMLASVRDAQRIHAWLVIVAKRHVVDYVRYWSTRMNAQIALVQEERERFVESPVETAMAREAAQEIRDQVAALPTAQRLAVELYYIQGLSYADIAQLTSQSINTVASHLRRGKKHLREKLRTELGGDDGQPS